MEFTMEFTGIECSNGHMNYYTRNSCDICGEEFCEKESEIDPLVSERRIFFKEYIAEIDRRKSQWEQYRDEIEKGVYKKNNVEEPFNVVAEALAKFTELTNEKSFDGIQVSKNSINDFDFKVRVEAIVQKIGMFYTIASELENLECTFSISNLRNRLIDTILHYAKFYRACFDAMLALDLDECSLIQNDIDKAISAGEQEINMFSRILNNVDIFNSINIFDEGSINQSAVFAMLLGDDDVTPMENIRLTARLTFDYFEDLLVGEYDSLDVEELLNLSSYMYLGSSVFNEISFNKKVQVVKQTLEKAFNLETDDFRTFMEKYLGIYIDLSKQMDEFSKFFVFVLGTTSDEALMMKSALTMYKDMAEGTFRDISKVLYYSKKVIEGKEIQHDEILKWSKFGVIYSEFLSDKNLGLECLTDGVNTVIRNAEAHVNYSINDHDKTIKLISSDARKRKVREKEYTYEEFFEVLNVLSETVFSIFAGITIFLLNKKTDFQEIYEAMQKSNEEKIGNIQLDMVMALNGLIITDREIFVDGEYNIQKLRVVDIREEREKDLETLLFTVVATIAKDYKKIDKYLIEIVDENEKVLGTAFVPTDELREKYDDEDMHGLTSVALARLGSEFTGDIKVEQIDSETMLLKVIYNLLDVIRKRALECVKSEISVSHKEYCEKIEVLCNDVDVLHIMYEKRYKDMVVPYKVIHAEGILECFKKLLKKLITTARNSTARLYVYEEFDAFSSLSKFFKEYYEKDIDFQEYVSKYTNDIYSGYNKLEVNKPCPCGSGKKYKKCCRTYV